MYIRDGHYTGRNLSTEILDYCLADTRSSDVAVLCGHENIFSLKTSDFKLLKLH